MEKKSDDEFDKVYGDSVFSITEDAQYPIFDAQLAKEGIINHSKPGSKRRKLNPENNCVQNSQFAHLESNTNFINKPQIPIPESNEIKIDEPLQLSREITESVPKFNRTESPSILNAPTLMNRFGSFGRGMMIGPSTAKPLPIKNASLQKPVPSPTEKAPIMKVNSTVVQKVCGPSTNSCFSKVVPKTLNNGTQIKPLNQPILSIPPKPATTPPPQAKWIIIEETKKEPEEKHKAEKPKGRKPAKGSKKKEIEKKEKLQEEDIDDDSESKSKLGLSGRKDVVYKTLLRSVKRYYSSEFESRTEYNGLTKSKQEKRWMKIIERFTTIVMLRVDFVNNIC